MAGTQNFGATGHIVRDIAFSPSTGGQLGTTTNDNASAGVVGEYIDATASNVTAAATGVYKSICNIVLTPGDWDIEAGVNMVTAAGGTTVATAGDNEVLISTTVDSSTGSTFAVDRFIWVWQNSTTYTNENVYAITIPRKRVSITTNTTYYLTALATYTSNAPRWYGIMSARRVR